MKINRLIILTIVSLVSAIFALGVLGVNAGPAVSTYTPHLPSQNVVCNQVDKALSFIPRGDGDGTVTDAEVGIGGWRYNRLGQSFVTFAHTLNTSANGYDVAAGRSNVASNAGTINDYPATLDLPQTSISGVMTILGRRGEIILTGDTANDPPLFKLPGAGEGTVRINVHDPDQDGWYDGCAESPLLRNFGFVVPEGGDFVQQEFFKAIVHVRSDGTVDFFEWTEVSTFKNVTPTGN